MNQKQPAPLDIPDSRPSRDSSGQAKVNRSQPGSSRSGMFSANVTWIDRFLVRKMLEVVGNPPVSISLWDGVEVTTPCDEPNGILTYLDRGALLKSMINPELFWGDLYCRGRVLFEGDLAHFLETIYLGIRGKGNPGPLRSLVKWLGHRRIFNTEKKARENIFHHYDIGNDFYRLWLDNEVMQYTCAYFSRPDMTLEEAQVAKLHHVCRKLQLQPGDYVIEAGCGWGGLAIFMAKHYGVRVRAYNISREQVQFARQRAEAEGLDDRVEFVLDDYRNIEGQYDVFVSIGMLEHVGVIHYEQLGALIRRTLKRDGRGLIHSIGRLEEGPMNAWIERRIFPGAQPPALSQFMRIFEPNDLVVNDVENLRLHYARTLQCWEQRFNAQRDAIQAMMDEEFVKAWGLYLSGSIAAFTSSSLQLFQVLFTHALNNDLPPSREYMYRERGSAAGRLSIVPPRAD